MENMDTFVYMPKTERKYCKKLKTCKALIMRPQKSLQNIPENISLNWVYFYEQYGATYNLIHALHQEIGKFPGICLPILVKSQLGHFLELKYVSYTVGKAFSRRAWGTLLRGNPSSRCGEIRGTSLGRGSHMELRGDRPWNENRLSQGSRTRYWDVMEPNRIKGNVSGTQEIQFTPKLSRPLKKRHLVSPISPLLPYGFMPNFVSSESSYQGESNRATFMTRVQDSTK